MTGCVLLVAAFSAGIRPVADSPWRPGTEVDVRRVSISLGFAGHAVFVHGRVPEDLEGMAAVVEAPEDGACRLVEKGRVGPVWLGVRQHRVGALPSLYLVLVHDPDRNVLRTSGGDLDLGQVNARLVASGGDMIGPEALALRAFVESTGGEGEGRTPEELFRALWQAQVERGLYGVDLNAIRVNRDGMFYYWLLLPEVAPEGRYTITSYYLQRSGLTVERQHLLVRKTGLVALTTRFANRRAALYGITTVLLAVVAGWLAGAFGRRRNGL